MASTRVDSASRLIRADAGFAATLANLAAIVERRGAMEPILNA